MRSSHLVVWPGMFMLLSASVSGQESESGPDRLGNVGPDTCGKDRDVLSRWFLAHGAPALVAAPLPPFFRNITANPYDDPFNPPADPDAPAGVCGIRWVDQGDARSAEEDPRRYQLRNFSSEAAAADAGFSVTHGGHCGACSSLQDLGTYMNRNLTAPTRLCGALGWFSTSAEEACLRMLGFSRECASIWAWNILNTRSKCLQKCLSSWWRDEPNNKPDGSLNDCLQCDEDLSGPNFKFFAGRTRRNSGIPSAIHRPPWQIWNITHCYWYGPLE